MRISRAINTVASARGVSTEHADVVFEPQEQPQRIVVPQPAKHERDGQMFGGKILVWDSKTIVLDSK